jgi:hypothetical protein
MAENKELLNLDLLSKAHEQFENIKEIPVNLNIDGEVRTFTVEMYKYFSPVSIKECLQEYVRNMDYAKVSNRDGFGDIAEPYLMYLLIKHFTNLGETMPSEFNKQLNSLKQMMNTSAFFQILIHFDEEEIKKIKEDLEVMMVTFEDNYKIIEEIKNKAKSQVENKFLVD